MKEYRELVRAGDESRSADAYDPSFRNWNPPDTARPNWTRQFQLATVLRVLRRRWRSALALAVVISLGVYLILLLMKDVYSPVANIEINPPGDQALTTRDTPGGVDDSKTDYIDTQVHILTGEELAMAVINTLKLDSNPEFLSKKKPNIIVGSIHNLLVSLGIKRPSTVKEAALAAFQRNLAVAQVKNSKLVSVSFSSHDPRLAAQVTNTLVNLFIELNYKGEYQTTMKAATWLSAQLADLRKKNEALDQALVDFQRKNGLPVDVDNKDAPNPIAQEVADLQHQLTQTQVERIQGQASLKTVVPGRESALPQMGASALINELQRRLAEAKSQLADAQGLFGANHPSVKKLRNQVDELETELAAERKRVIDELNATYDAAQIREQLISKSLGRSQADMGDLNAKMIRYRALKSEAQANEDLYNTLFARLQEAGITAGLRSTNMRVVNEARVLQSPTKPNRLLITILGVFMGIIGGISLAFFRDSQHDVVRSADTLQALTGLSVSMIPVELRGRRLLSPSYRIGSMPEAKSVSRFFIDRPRSPEFEAVKNLYTSVILRSASKPTKVILVASPGAKEGKTTVAVNLAIALGRHGRVCLIDADLRKPSVRRAERGLRDVLEGTAEVRDVLETLPDNENVAVLPAGVPSAGEEMMAWPRMCEVVRELARRFEHVIIDSPPLLPFPDARALATIADGVLLVTRCGSTEREAVKQSIEMLEEVDAKPLGVVLNAVDRDSPSFRYYHYGYSYK